MDYSRGRGSDFRNQRVAHSATARRAV